ncbi:MAG TPA: alpha/beta fold hydrolase [Burkholderiales bacterium]|jgi:3-oxoadipate enol-lactonase|nr:alpha/beta fold hydrolase [Burkholderiales bacterium]
MAILQANGGKIEVDTFGAGPDLVLLHSLLAERSAFDRVVPLLARKRRVRLVSLPGYGASSPAGPAVEDYADRLAGLFDALELPRATDVLGNGFGGFIAVALAARHGERFRRLIAAPALAGFPEAAREPFRILAAKVESQGMASVLDMAIRRMFPEAFIAAHPDVVEERKRALAKADPACFRTACLALSRLDLSAVLVGIGNPTLVMAGALDATTPPALARQLAAGIPGARFLEIPGCGHCPQIEDPQGFVAAVEDFLA